MVSYFITCVKIRSWEKPGEGKVIMLYRIYSKILYVARGKFYKFDGTCIMYGDVCVEEINNSNDNNILK